MDIAVLIVSYRSLADVRVCLEALGKSTHTDFRVVICENGGHAAFEAARAALPETLPGGQPVSIREAPGNLGYAGGINFALDHAPGADAYWILNPDTQPAPDALAHMVARLSEGDCGMVGHDLVLTDGRLASRGGGQWRRTWAQAISIDKGARRSDPSDPALEGKIDYVVGASILVSAQALRAAGRMRDDYFLYCEEVEWCLRARRQGIKLGYAPEAVVIHAHGTTTGGGGELRDRSKLSVYLIARNRVLVTRDLFAERLPITQWLILLHLTGKYLLKAQSLQHVRYAWEGWWAGLRDERGAPAWLSAS